MKFRDLSVEPFVTVDRDPKTYLGHVSTLQLDNGNILCVYPEGHGKGQIRYQTSGNRGESWSRQPVPKSWTYSKETPILYKLDKDKLIMFSSFYPLMKSESYDNGKTWSELESIGNYGGIAAPSSLIRWNGKYLAFFHDNGKFLYGGKNTHRGFPCGEYSGFKVYSISSSDNGNTWSYPKKILEHSSAKLAEPECITNGKQIMLLFRNNNRKEESLFSLSKNGKGWGKPIYTHPLLTGHRHIAKYNNDGRLLISFRDTCKSSQFKGHWVAWVGTWDDIINKKAGEQKILLHKNVGKESDCAYPGVEYLSPNTFLVTTYGHWVKGQPPFIISKRITI